MKVYLINPRFESTIWSFEGLQPFTGTKFLTTPLGLVTVAALTPKHWDVEIADENVEEINFDTDADLIGIGPFNVQYQRALQIAAEFRKRGKPVVIGGPYCSLFSEAFIGHCDHRLSGEAEQIWPEFLSDFEKGTAREFYSALDKKVSLETSPVPRYDLIRGEFYNIHVLQTSRGCPFSCEFCDIIVMDGRVPRIKTVEQVLEEVDGCVKQGAHYILFGDANFIGNIPFARKLLTALAEYSRKNNYPVEFCCELTINVAHQPDLLQLMQDANFYSVFIGIESPRRESLIETKKNQNTRRSIADDIAKIHSHHISVMAGMIVGFDSDDRLIFKEQYDFLFELGIPFTTCGTLMALPNTPLLKRLQAEGRMLNLDWASMNGHGAADCNFVPKQMTLEELRKGYNWLIRVLYRYDSFGHRLDTLLSRFQNKVKEHKRAGLDFKFSAMLVKIFAYYLLTRDHERRQFFIKAISKASKGPSSMGKWLEFFRWIAAYRSFRKYVSETHGVPETADPNSPPFTEIVPDAVSEYEPEPETVSIGT
ncbi:MAG: DUF4070 domain-containing protein [Candidatus Omnitrophica bacterium]|nr:DUF4070 domain-containing protein [Candidatus Omnitrophota bacterium]